jgi:hypothetical protein
MIFSSSRAGTPVGLKALYRGEQERIFLVLCGRAKLYLLAVFAVCGHSG